MTTTDDKPTAIRADSSAYCVSQKNPPLSFSGIFPNRLGILSRNFTCLLYVLIYRLDYKFLFNYLQFCNFDEVMRDHNHAQNVHYRPKRTPGGRT